MGSRGLDEEGVVNRGRGWLFLVRYLPIDELGGLATSELDGEQRPVPWDGVRFLHTLVASSPAAWRIARRSFWRGRGYVKYWG